MKQFLRKYIWVFLIIVLAMIFPQSLTDQAELNMRMIVTGIALDYSDDKYDITAQVILPSSKVSSGGINAQVSFVSAQGKTISEGVQQISYKIGKLPELSHLEYIVVGKSLNDINIASSLDYFFRNYKIKNSIMLLSANENAGEILKKTSKLELGVALSIQKMYLASESSMSAYTNNYVDFVIDSYSTSGISVLDTFEITEKNSSKDSSSKSEESQSSGEANIEMYSPLSVYKKGLYVDKIEDKNQIIGYYFTNFKSSSGNFHIDGFSYGDIQNANINLRIDQLSRKLFTTIKDGKINHTIKIVIDESHIDEIAASSINKKLYMSVLDKDTELAIVKAFQEKIKDNIYSLFENMQSKNIDIFKIADNAERYNKQEWQNFISNLSNPEEYIKNISLSVEVEFNQIK